VGEGVFSRPDVLGILFLSRATSFFLSALARDRRKTWYGIGLTSRASLVLWR